MGLLEDNLKPKLPRNIAVYMRFDRKLLERADLYAHNNFYTRSALMRQALQAFLDNKEDEPEEKPAL